MIRPHRKRIKHYEIAGQPRFLTFSCHQRLPLLGNPKIRDGLVDRLVIARDDTSFQLHAWVIMPEHVHLMLVPASDSTVAAILSAIKRPFAQSVLARWRELNAPILGEVRDHRGRYHFWQGGPGYDRNIRDEEEFFEKFEYVHANPVKRGLVERTIDWPWSSARWYAGFGDAMIDLNV